MTSVRGELWIQAAITRFTGLTLSRARINVLTLAFVLAAFTSLLWLAYQCKTLPCMINLYYPQNIRDTVVTINKIYRQSCAEHRFFCIDN